MFDNPYDKALAFARDNIIGGDTTLHEETARDFYEAGACASDPLVLCALLYQVPLPFGWSHLKTPGDGGRSIEHLFGVEVAETMVMMEQMEGDSYEDWIHAVSCSDLATAVVCQFASVVLEYTGEDGPTPNPQAFADAEDLLGRLKAKHQNNP